MAQDRVQDDAGSCRTAQEHAGATSTRLTQAVPQAFTDGWLPEEEAPHDGTVVIVPGGLGYWLANPEHGPPGWFTITACDWPGRRIQWEVTHWMHLPKPPHPLSSFTGGGDG